jgi:hypothetical protein
LVGGRILPPLLPGCSHPGAFYLYTNTKKVHHGVAETKNRRYFMDDVMVYGVEEEAEEEQKRFRKASGYQ